MDLRAQPITLIKCDCVRQQGFTYESVLVLTSNQNREIAGGNRASFNMNMQQPEPSMFWRSAAQFAAVGFGAVAAFFLFTEHRAHLFGWLPYLFLLACPVMMLFMHHGHNTHDHHDPSPDTPKQPDTHGRISP